MKVRLKPGWLKAYPELTPGNVYRVLGISIDSLQIISDAGEPILFNRTAFEFIDPVRPSNWVEERGTEGGLYAFPRELSEPRNFFERWHDGDHKIQMRLRHYVYELCRAERAQMADPPNRYIRVQWNHTDPEEPVTLFSELDEERREVRRVEVFADGRIGYANERGSFGRTRLAERPISTIDEIAAIPEFEPLEITRAEFDEIFDKALSAEEAAQGDW